MVTSVLPITEHLLRRPRHTGFHLACGPADAPAIVLLHGWPELSLSWRHLLRALGGQGWRAIAPDMRGYGRSSQYARHEDYAIEHAVHDMLELLDALGRERAVWVGHDWGTPVAWGLAAHHADRCAGVAGLCVPYLPEGFSLPALLPLVDRRVYPAERFPAGQWDYHLYYEEQFERARAVMQADPGAMVRAMFRKGDPTGRGKPSMLASIRAGGGWFRGLDRAPDLPRDADVISEEDARVYTEALARNGFFGPNSWYMNAARNADYARRAPDGGRLAMPVLFLHAEYDYVCETIDSRLAEPMRAACARLTEERVPTGHWMAQERPAEVHAALTRWLAANFPKDG